VPLADYGEQQIFEPLGMTVTHFHTDATRIVKGRVIGYDGATSEWTIDVPNNERAGAGGLYTNIPDLQKWDENFYTAKVGGPELIKKLQTPAHLNSGKPIAYAWGLEIGSYRGLPIVEHSGSLHGYRAELIRFPSQHTSVAILCNHSAIVPSRLARKIADVVLKTDFREPAGGGRGSGDATGPADHSSPWPEDLSGWVGSYYSDELQSTFVITAHGRELLLRRDTDAAPRALTLLARDNARAPGFTIAFIHGTSGTGRDAPVTGLVVSAGVIHDLEFVRRP
jgi:CubicO group peptidase (beta-lactamase class C family)